MAVIDFYHDERSGDVGFPRHHLVPRETVIDEMSKAGDSLIREHTFLSRQYFLEFASGSSVSLVGFSAAISPFQSPAALRSREVSGPSGVLMVFSS